MEILIRKEANGKLNKTSVKERYVDMKRNENEMGWGWEILSFPV